jgi:hypothetical protein
MLPDTEVDRLLEPPVRVLLPSRKRPAPTIDPTVVPPLPSDEISKLPLALFVMAALAAALVL